MTKVEIMNKFHDELITADSEQLETLHSLAEDGEFIREAGPEFVLAIQEVWTERH
jgi:hypothetical protein